MAEHEKLPFRFVIRGADLREVLEDYVAKEIDKRLPPEVDQYLWGVLGELHIVVQEMPPNVSLLGRRPKK